MSNTSTSKIHKHTQVWLVACESESIKNQPVRLDTRQLIDLEKVQWSMTTEQTNIDSVVIIV